MVRARGQQLNRTDPSYWEQLKRILLEPVDRKKRQALLKMR
jgi:hypothetical protein